MSDNDDATRLCLTVPKRCARGHELIPRTTTIKTNKSGTRLGPIGWECVRCLRVVLWEAHYPGKRVPADVLAEELFVRQASATVKGRPADWTHRVVFRSGWQYADPDPTPDLRAARDGLCANGHRQLPERVYVASDGREFCRVCRAEQARRRRAGLPKPPDPRPLRLRERFAADLGSVVSA
ncbi:hypothetical protein AB0G00_16530 [Nocardia salmonicida]|uniref:hypothetical protein n=1 Tax=Nocardia salmonicida TaxID=53431 RepID=UPI0033EDFF4B